MEQEMRAKGNVATTMDPPPSYQEPKNKTKPFLIAIVTVTLVTLLVVSVGVFYIMVNGQSRPAVVNNVTTDGDEPIVIVRDVPFQMFDGVPRNEQMMVEGNKLTIENRHDGYKVVFDFDRNLALFKNRTTFSCLFTRLDDLPVDMKIDNLTANLPVYFNDAFTPSERLLNHTNAMMFSNRLDRIPTGYLELTNTEECADGSSFWIEPMGEQRTRNTRQARGDIDIIIIETDCEIIIVVIEYL